MYIYLYLNFLKFLGEILFAKIVVEILKHEQKLVEKAIEFFSGEESKI